MTKKGNTTKYLTSRTIMGAIFALVVLSSLAVSGIYAKYITQEEASGVLSSPAFYFTSDILSEETPTYTLNPGITGTTEIKFVLRNNADNYRISKKDIEVSIDVQPSAGVSVKIEDESTTIGKIQAHSEGTAPSFIYVTVSGLKNGETYKITATGKAGFISKLSATVTVKPDEKNVYMHVDNSDSNYLLLTVWTQNISGKASIAFPAGLIPDATDPAMSTVKNYNGSVYEGATFEDGTNFSSAYSSHVYRFFKPTDGSYTANNFTVTVNGVTATQSIPK